MMNINPNPFGSLNVPQEEKPLLRAFQERRKKLQFEVIKDALIRSDAQADNYGKLRLAPGVFTQAQAHTLLGPNYRLSFDNVYDTSSNEERRALALATLEKVAKGGQLDYSVAMPTIYSNKDGAQMIEERLRYGSPKIWDEAANKLKRGVQGVEDVLHSRSFARPTRL